MVMVLLFIFIVEVILDIYSQICMYILHRFFHYAITIYGESNPPIDSVRRFFEKLRAASDGCKADCKLSSITLSQDCPG
ncbi:MAG: hypothetical protein QXQ29_01860 [Candidatus Bathyarchaeia archaeon]